MKYKSHPYYDDSDALDWLYPCPDDWLDLEPAPERTLQNLLHTYKPWLCGLALARIRAAAGAEYLAERPYPEMNEFLFFPIDDTGFRVYITYFFNQQLDDASPDSDFWWAIINCPNAVKPLLTGSREAYVIGLGWYVA